MSCICHPCEEQGTLINFQVCRSPPAHIFLFALMIHLSAMQKNLQATLTMESGDSVPKKKPLCLKPNKLFPFSWEAPEAVSCGFLLMWQSSLEEWLLTLEYRHLLSDLCQMTDSGWVSFPTGSNVREGSRDPLIRKGKLQNLVQDLLL